MGRYPKVPFKYLRGMYCTCHVMTSSFSQICVVVFYTEIITVCTRVLLAGIFRTKLFPTLHFCAVCYFPICSRLYTTVPAKGNTFSWASPSGQRSFCCVVFGPSSLLSDNSAFIFASRESYDESRAFVKRTLVCAWKRLTGVGETLMSKIERSNAANLMLIE